MGKFNEELDGLLKKQQDIETAKVEKKKNLETGVEWDEKKGKGQAKIKSKDKPSKKIWDAHLKEWGFDPNEFEVLNNTVQYRGWDTNMGNGQVERMHYYKADIVKIGQNPYYDPTELIKEIKKKKPRKNTEKGTQAFLVALSDWQLGKEDGDGVEGVTKRVLEGIEQTKNRVKELRKQGVTFNKCVVACLGDLVEGCDGFYSMQTFSVQINQRDQLMLGTNLLVKFIEELSPLFSEIQVISVGGNHGENRKNGKAYTDFADNFDLVIADNAARVFSANKKSFGHIKFLTPESDLSVTVDVNGTIITFAHGHQFRTGAGGASMKAHRWLEKQAKAKLPAGQCDILLSAHFHHESILSEGGITHIQTPALDGGSLWVENTLGLTSNPGITTFTVDNTGFNNYQVLKS
tara:strand:- start:1367 stop:2581 length:1215 start_codon:yes stop_codon:yes gene_type:complete